MSLFHKKDTVQPISDEQKKKKRRKRWTIVLIVIAAIFIFLHFGLAHVVKAAVSGIGPLITGTRMELKHAAIYPILGYVSLGDFTIANPKGYHSPYAVTVKKVVVDLGVLSVFSSKKVLEEITISGVDLYYEQGLSANNLKDLMNMATRFQSDKDAEAEKKEKSGTETVRLQIDKLRINNITVHTVFSLPGTEYNTAAPLPVVPVSLDKLGTGDKGITPADLFCVIFDNLTLGAISAVGGAAEKSMNSAAEAVKDLGSQIGNTGKDAAGAAKKMFQSILPGKK